ncbi:MAG: isoprenylcysteine carboxylmethyltransferase family protein [Rhodobacteraceae bacterium]|nr:isoprenylcysteine carboxylmethyltransferase family protein [Paracoccaceae bacterium]
MKWIDLPPVWLALFLSLAWIQAQHLPVGGMGGAWADFVGGLCVGGGLLLMVLAFAEMRRQRTTVIPHRIPDQLVDGGIFRRSRNPIYLGDTLVLVGMILRWEALPSLLLVPLFMWLITDRFIRPEETRLDDTFGARFAAYKARTRRWI